MKLTVWTFGVPLLAFPVITSRYWKTCDENTFGILKASIISQVKIINPDTDEIARVNIPGERCTMGYNHAQPLRSIREPTRSLVKKAELDLGK